MYFWVWQYTQLLVYVLTKGQYVELKKKNTPTPCKIFYSNIVNSLKNASAQLSYNTSPLTKNNIIVFIDLFSI